MEWRLAAYLDILLGMTLIKRLNIVSVYTNLCWFDCKESINALM